MTRIRPIGVAGFLALAMMLTVIPASGASAAKLLQLQVENVPVANGSPGDVGIEVAECFQYDTGTVGINDASTVVLTEKEVSYNECPAGKTLSGSLKEAKLTAGRSATVKGPLTLAVPGPCKYKFASFKGKFEIPGAVLFEGTAVGALVKKGSDPTCALKMSQPVVGLASNEVFGEPFQTRFG
jgi:hypothetical protein